MQSFGASAPGGTLFRKFGFTAEHVVDVMKQVIK
jgi:transketolase